MSQNSSWSEIRDFRRQSIENGYAPIRVKDRDKRPVAKDWTKGEPCVSLLNSYAGSNTGLLTSGLRVIDIDIDDSALVQKVIREIRNHLPGGAIIRTRSNSPRRALVYRAAVGMPGKLKVAGAAGAIEVLGNGQQFVAHGIHPSGADIEWTDGRSPASVPISALPSVTEEMLHKCLAACEKLLAGLDQEGGAKAAHVTSPGNLPKQDGLGPEPQEAPVTGVGNLPPKSDPDGAARAAAEELGAGIGDGHWFSRLQPHVKEELVRTCLNAIDNTENDPRGDWLIILFAVVDAGRQGCPNARSLALEWSRRGVGWTGEADFDIAWGSAK
jgi:hypothetical protein